MTKAVTMQREEQARYAREAMDALVQQREQRERAAREASERITTALFQESVPTIGTIGGVRFPGTAWDVPPGYPSGITASTTLGYPSSLVGGMIGATSAPGVITEDVTRRYARLGRVLVESILVKDPQTLEANDILSMLREALFLYAMDLGSTPELAFLRQEVLAFVDTIQRAISVQSEAPTSSSETRPASPVLLRRVPRALETLRDETDDDAVWD